MAVKTLKSSNLKNTGKYRSIFSSTGIAGFGFVAVEGDFESIATVTVGGGGAANIEFTSIPGTYQHLQVRVVGRSSKSSTVDFAKLQINSDTGSNYRQHYLLGDGSSAVAGGTSAAYIDTGYVSGSTSTAGLMGAFIIDILDYASTSKNTVTRLFGGADTNGGGYANIYSGLWVNTASVTALKLFPGGASTSWQQHTTAALYGIKAP